MKALRAGAGLLAMGSLVSSSCTPSPFFAYDALETKAELAESVRERVLEGDVARSDGYVYAVDVGLLMIFAAGEGDLALYRRLRELATAELILDRPEDPYTRGFVRWRYRESEEADASGTTEALRIAEGLWRGAAAFDAPDDRELAIVVLDGYARHAAIEGGVWMIRNYFNLGTRAFATNSYLVDYAPDFVAEVARTTGRDDLAAIARESYALIRSAQAETGLLYDIVQPEVLTLLDDQRMVVFSPNDAVQVSNAATVAVCAVEGLPAIARALVDFAHERMPGLRGTYYGRTGEVARDKRPGIEAWGALVRLAVALGDDEAADAFYPFLVSNAARQWRIPDDAWLYVAAELLLGLQAVTPEASPVSSAGSK